VESAVRNTDAGGRLRPHAQDNPLIVGTTYGAFGGPSAGLEDAFVLKIDAGGNLDWVTQFGGPGYERARGIDVAPNGHIFVGGSTLPTPGVVDLTFQDAFWTELAPDGTQSWINTFGTAGSFDSVSNILVDVGGDVLLGGLTAGSLFGSGGGGGSSDGDPFVVKFDVNAVPEPSAALFGLVALIAGRLALPRMDRRRAYVYRA
jgi:hypothetical protein